ncbi:Duplicated homeodomain-like superfamily protein [Perilla frutescens var. frutescens]|nr:Duplicated homeodomain-like superfamily protein [Perilla frutescens var. frutescens]
METLFPSSLVSNSRWLMHEGEGKSRPWTKEENKTFESALAIFDEETPDRWFKVAGMIPGKSVYDVINQYRELVADVSDIEAGLVPIPAYFSSSFTLEYLHPPFHLCRKPARAFDQERKKGVPWTQDEHRRFLLGLEKHGKGDWKNISRNFVVSKTPTQVASHAQKYYLRQVSGGKDKRRPSIHDISIHMITGSSCQSEEATLPSLDKSEELISSLHKADQNTPAQVLSDWNDTHEGPLMVFDSFLAYPCNIATQTL